MGRAELHGGLMLTRGDIVVIVQSVVADLAGRGIVIGAEMIDKTIYAAVDEVNNSRNGDAAVVTALRDMLAPLVRDDQLRAHRVAQEQADAAKRDAVLADYATQALAAIDAPQGVKR